MATPRLGSEGTHPLLAEAGVIELVGKPGCHLCEEALAVVSRIAAEEEVPWRERSILEEQELFDAYAEQIPVILVNGKVHDIWRVDPERLRAAIRDLG